MDFLVQSIWDRQRRDEELEKAADEARQKIGDGLEAVAQGILDERDRRAEREEQGMPLSERARRAGQRAEADKQMRAQNTEYRERQERLRKEDEEHARQVAERRRQMEAERRDALNDAVTATLKGRYLAAGGTEAEFSRDLPELLKKYRIEATLGSGATDPKAEFAAYFRSRSISGVPE